MELKKILLAEDDIDLANLIKLTLQKYGYIVDVAHNGDLALNMFVEKKYPVVISDLNMPKISGEELAKKIKEINNNTLIIIETGRAESEFIIKIMKIGVFDYMIKPINLDDLVFKVKKAFDHYELVSVKESIMKEKEIRFNEQINWFKYKERLLNNEEFETKNTFFNRIFTSFNQGTGIGAIYSLIDIIIDSAKLSDGKYIINSELINLLKHNIYTMSNAMNMISEIDNIINYDITSEDMNFIDFYIMIKNTIDNIKDKISIKNHSFIFSKDVINPDKIFKINIELIKKVITEILINSLKFSKENSKIIILYGANDNTFNITIINEPEPINDIIGIPKEYENLIFEPFFRISKFVYENYSTLDYGLGLTFCEKIIQKHKGSISLSNINDFIDYGKEPSVKVKTEIILPIYS